MASGNYVLQQQQAEVESRIKSLINSDLKEICKAYNYQVSGTKPVLQKRCLEILHNMVSEGNRIGFEELRYRIDHHGRALPNGQLGSSSSNQYNTGNIKPVPHQPHLPSPNRPALDLSRLPSGGRWFKPSPFYEIVDTALELHELPEMPQNRHTVRATLTLTFNQAHRLREDRSLRLLLYCGASSGIAARELVDVAFPNQIEVRVNGDEVKNSYKGLKNKPGSTKPADMTDQIRKSQGYQNQISVTYALTTRRFAFLVYVVRYVNATTLIERIKAGKVIPKQRVLDEMNRANADPDIAATSSRMSLKDPVSTIRITLPVRSTVCTHNQCFDGAMFLQLQEQAPQWTCPVCDKNVPFESLCVDKFFEDILQRTSTSIEKVDIEPNGEWRVIKEEDDRLGNGGASNFRPRASYDHDSDDDSDPVEIVDAGSRLTNGASTNGRSSMSMAMPTAPLASALNTPPVSSREPSLAHAASSTQRASSKRPASAVIDLTLSDDDDEPPRPAKRQSTSTHYGPSSRHPSQRAPFPDPPHSSAHRSSGPDGYRRPSTSFATGQAEVTNAGVVNGNHVQSGSKGPSYYPQASSSGTNGSGQQVQSSPPRPEQSEAPRLIGFSLKPLAQSNARQHQQHRRPSDASVQLPPIQPQQQHSQHEAWRKYYVSSSPSE